MHYSYIAKLTNSVSTGDLKKLDDYIRNINTKDVHLEVLLVNTIKDYSSFQPKSRLLQIIHSNLKDHSSMGKAVSSASGDYIIFTTVANIIADTDHAMLNAAKQCKGFLAGGPVRNFQTLWRRVGFRDLSYTPYIIVQQCFASKNIEKITHSFGSILIAADKHLGLKLLMPSPALPQPVVGHIILVRPYIQIIKKKINQVYIAIKHRFEARKAARLRAQVPNVKYSPTIPIFIILRDRVEPLRHLVKWLENENTTNIIFVDNNSTYPPLLDYLDNTPYEVIHLNSNAGHTSPWSKGIVDIYAKNKPFIVTDPDIIPSPNAHGAIKYFCELLTRHPERTKAGFSLRIDNLPEHYDLKDHVIAWESIFWQSKIKGENDVYDAEIDTTFAVYRPNTPYTLGPGMRTGEPFTAEHEPWYVNSKKVPAELQYYRDHADKVIGSWGINSLELTETYKHHKNK